MALPAKNKVSPGSLNPTACLLLTEAVLAERGDIDQRLKGGNGTPSALEYILYLLVCGMLFNVRALLF